MKLAQVAVSLQLSTQLVVGLLLLLLLLLERRLIFCTTFAARGTHAVVFIKVKSGILAVVFWRCGCVDAPFAQLGKVSRFVWQIYLEQALLGFIHVGVVTELAAGLLQVLDAVFAIADSLIAAGQIVLRNYGKLHACFIAPGA